MNARKTVLFGGYAPVHFVCFKPIYDELSKVKGVDVFLTGGMRKDGPNGTTLYDPYKLYGEFKIPRKKILTLDAIKRRSFDMTFSAHTSGFFPKSTRTKVQVFHGLSFRNLAVREDQRTYDALFLAGPYMMRAFKSKVFGKARKAAAKKLLPIGFVKLDRLVNGTLDRRAILRQVGLKGDRKVILYAPTGDKRNSMETMGLEVIRRIRDAGKWDLLIKLHDHPKNRDIDWAKQLRAARLLGPHVKLVKGYDVAPFLFVSDLLVSDASSVANEYTVLDRPIVFLDVPGLLAKARRKGALVDLKTWGRRGGTTVRKPDDVVAAIAKSLRNPKKGSRVRRAIAKDLFFQPGGATGRAMGWVLKRLGLDAARANKPKAKRPRARTRRPALRKAA